MQLRPLNCTLKNGSKNRFYVMYILPQLKTNNPSIAIFFCFRRRPHSLSPAQTSRIQSLPWPSLSATSHTALAPPQKQVVFSLSPPLALDTLLVFSPSFPKSLAALLTYSPSSWALYLHPRSTQEHFCAHRHPPGDSQT